MTESSVALPPRTGDAHAYPISPEKPEVRPRDTPGHGPAYEMALVALHYTDGTANPTREAVAQKIIDLAKTGERDPERLCDGALKATQPMAPTWISDPSPLPPHASPPAQPDFEFEPVRRSARTIARPEPLRDNPLQSHLAGVLENNSALWVLQVLV